MGEQALVRGDQAAAFAPLPIFHPRGRMVRLKKLSRAKLDSFNKSDKQRMTRNPSVRVAETKAMESRRLDVHWTEWTPGEAYKELLKTCGGAGPDYVERLLPFIQEQKRMYPGQTFGALKDNIAKDYSQFYLSY